MKRVITVLLILIVVFSNNLLAGEKIPVTKQVKQSFSINFPRAKDVSFQVYGDAILVSYFENCKHNLALYRENGELIGTGSYISEDEIPLTRIRSLQKKFGRFEIIGSLEFSTVDQSYFGLQLATEKDNILVRVYDNGKMEIVKKEGRR